MKSRVLILALLLTAAAPLLAQSFLPVSANIPDLEMSRSSAGFSLSPVRATPRMSPELALDAYQRRAAQQAEMLGEYTASTRIEAALPDSAQHGEMVVKRHYVAPKSLSFQAVSFQGDKFVKSNVIGRMLQSEVDHVEKQETAQTAITSSNYKFSYAGTENVDGRPTHIYNVKPRQKRAGLFRGKIYVDAVTGSLRRAQGTVKSPSFFVKKIEFFQDYADVGEFTLPVHMHSEANARIIGRAVIDIVTQDYTPTVQTALMSANAPGSH